MSKKRRTPAQKAASVANLQKARQAARFAGRVRKGYSLMSRVESFMSGTRAR